MDFNICCIDRAAVAVYVFVDEDWERRASAGTSCPRGCLSSSDHSGTAPLSHWLAELRLPLAAAQRRSLLPPRPSGAPRVLIAYQSLPGGTLLWRPSSYINRTIQFALEATRVSGGRQCGMRKT